MDSTKRNRLLIGIRPFQGGFRNAVLTLSLLGLCGFSNRPAFALTYGQQVVAAVLMGEARGEGATGMTAVAEVIRKRADTWQISPLAVVKKPKHFACLNGTTPEELIRKFWADKQWSSALAIARLAYNEPERLPGITNGATHFDHGSPYWAEGQPTVAVVGNLKFYRLRLP